MGRPWSELGPDPRPARTGSGCPALAAVRLPRLALPLHAQLRPLLGRRPGTLRPGIPARRCGLGPAAPGRQPSVPRRPAGGDSRGSGVAALGARLPAAAGSGASRLLDAGRQGRPGRPALLPDAGRAGGRLAVPPPVQLDRPGRVRPRSARPVAEGAGGRVVHPVRRAGAAGFEPPGLRLGYQGLFSPLFPVCPRLPAGRRCRPGRSRSGSPRARRRRPPGPGERGLGLPGLLGEGGRRPPVRVPRSGGLPPGAARPRRADRRLLAAGVPPRPLSLPSGGGLLPVRRRPRGAALLRPGRPHSGGLPQRRSAVPGQGEGWVVEYAAAG
jgi:hypothetical protein